MDNKKLSVEELTKEFLNAPNAKPISERDKPLYETLAKNEINKYIKETSFSGDQATLGSIIMPVFRRSFTNQFMRNLVGTQPLTDSNGYIFALRYDYSGNSTQKGDVYGSSYSRALLLLVLLILLVTFLLVLLPLMTVLTNFLVSKLFILKTKKPLFLNQELVLLSLLLKLLLVLLVLTL